MRNSLMCGVALLLVANAPVLAQTPARPMSPEGSAHVQVLGTWVKGERPAFTLGRETYQNGKLIWGKTMASTPLKAVR